MKLLVDDKNIECNKGDLLIEVLLNNNIKIPHFCYQEDLGCDGNCRMCMVEIKGAKRPQIACDTFVDVGMEIFTISEGITEVKRSILELELLNHPVDCAICDQAGECKLQDYYMDFGLYKSNLSTSKTLKAKQVDLGSNVILDEERCVLCTRCIRFTSDITKTHELGLIDRGDEVKIGVAPGTKLDNNYAMNVVDLCPVGALTSKDFRFKQRVWFLESSNSICHGCSRGCNITIDYNQTKYSKEKIHRFLPRRNNDINKSFLCDEGRLSYKNLNDSFTQHSSNISHLKDLLNEDKKLALVSPSLSCEQLQVINEYCKEKNIELFSLQYFDEKFGDDFLRTNDKSANFYTVKELKINTKKEEFFKSLEKAKIVINFDHSYLKTKELEQKKLIQFTSISCEDNYDLVYGFANFAHDSGSIVNCDGIKQVYKATKFSDNNPRLVDLLGDLR